jgi:cardiolipin synthase
MTLANWITSSRFVLALLVYWQLTVPTQTGLYWGIGLLILAGLTDLADGYAARARDEISELGKTLDPLADKLLILATLFALAVRRGLPGWMVGVYLIKELIQVIAGAYALRRVKQVIPANRWGKSATFIFFLGFGLFLLNRTVGIIVIGAAIILSFYALYTYYLAFRRLTHE